jgi:hypothetical protein
MKTNMILKKTLFDIMDNCCSFPNVPEFASEASPVFAASEGKHPVKHNAPFFLGFRAEGWSGRTCKDFLKEEKLLRPTELSRLPYS